MKSVKHYCLCYLSSKYEAYCRFSSFASLESLWKNLTTALQKCSLVLDSFRKRLQKWLKTQKTVLIVHIFLNGCVFCRFLPRHYFFHFFFFLFLLFPFFSHSPVCSLLLTRTYSPQHISSFPTPLTSIFPALSFVLSKRKYQQKIQSESPQLGSEHGLFFS